MTVPSALPCPVRPTTVLVAEDHPLNQKIARNILEKRGFRVAVAIDGRHAIQLWRSAPTAYDVILMDIDMPHLDGLKAARRIRRMEARTASHVPIIAYTASSLDADREQCLSAGMDDYIPKPSKPEHLYAALDRALARRQ